MPASGTFLYTGSLSLGANSLGCVQHGLPCSMINATTAVAWYQSSGTYGSLTGVLTLAPNAVVVFNSGGSAIPGVVTAQVYHSMIV